MALERSGMPGCAMFDVDYGDTRIDFFLRSGRCMKDRVVGECTRTSGKGHEEEGSKMKLKRREMVGSLG